jgi:hypothetical protein
MQIPENNRNIIEDIFAGSVKATDIKNKFDLLAQFAINQAHSLEEIRPEGAHLLKRIYAIVSDCEYYSLLSLELSWEVATNLIKDLQAQADIETRKSISDINKIIITIEDSLYQLYELINIELQLVYSLENCRLTYNRRFPERVQQLN